MLPWQQGESSVTLLFLVRSSLYLVYRCYGSIQTDLVTCCWRTCITIATREVLITLLFLVRSSLYLVYRCYGSIQTDLVTCCWGTCITIATRRSLNNFAISGQIKPIFGTQVPWVNTSYPYHLLLGNLCHHGNNSTYLKHCFQSSDYTHIGYTGSLGQEKFMP